MAAVIFAFGYLINSAVMAHKEEKKRRQLKYEVSSPSSASGGKEKSTERRHKQGQGHKKEKGESLRAKAVRKLHGKGGNPSQLGDPISVKAETSDTVPTDDESGETTLRGSEDSGLGAEVGGGRRASHDSRDGSSSHRSQRHHPTRREQAVGGNPSMLGDPVSVKAETEQRPINAEEEDAASESTVRSKL